MSAHTLPVLAQADVSPLAVTLEFKDTPLRQALEMLFQDSGHRFQIEEGATGVVNALLNEVPWEQALRVILASQDLRSRRQGDVYYISRRPGIGVTADPRIAPEVVRDVKEAADATVAFFQDTYGLELTRFVGIILVTDKEAYRQALTDTVKMSPKWIDRTVEYSGGISWGNYVVSRNVGLHITRPERQRDIIHEIVHQYQSDIAASDARGILTWVREGMADAIAAQVLDKTGLRTMEDDRQGWLSLARKYKAFPEFSALNDLNGWYAAQDRYGSWCPDATAYLAVDLLVQRKGHDALIAYLRSAKTQDAASAFQDAFGVSLDDFTRDFAAYLNGLLARGGPSSR